MTELGKSGKMSGQQHPRDTRRIDPVPPRPTPSAKPHRKRSKPYGFSYEMKWWNKGWGTTHQWYRSEAARDQAMAACERSYVARALGFRNFQKCSRAADHVPGTRDAI